MVPTPHNEAKKEDIASSVIMPGDPQRAKWIASEFLEGARLVNNIRGIQGYTGKWKGVPVTVMASGMGISSAGIYIYELFNFYGVQKIIRPGTCGSIHNNIKVSDIIIADRAFTDSNFPEKLGLGSGYVAMPDEELHRTLVEEASKISGVCFHNGPVLTEELYYGQEVIIDEWVERGVLAFEMEAAILFAYAKKAGKQAAALFTVSNNILTGEEMPPELREKSLSNMVIIALNSATAPLGGEKK